LILFFVSRSENSDDEEEDEEFNSSSKEAFRLGCRLNAVEVGVDDPFFGAEFFLLWLLLEEDLL